MKHATLVVLLGIVFSGCDRGEPKIAPANRDLGTGLNTVTHAYGRTVPEVWDAAVESVKAHGLRLEGQERDGFGGKITAWRATDDKVTVEVRTLDEKKTQVSVRVEPGNRNMAEMIHQTLAERIGPAAD